MCCCVCVSDLGISMCMCVYVCVCVCMYQYVCTVKNNSDVNSEYVSIVCKYVCVCCVCAHLGGPTLYIYICVPQWCVRILGGLRMQV